MNKEELIKINPIYQYEHGITDRDVEMANYYIQYIETTRDEKMPKAGDILEFTNKHGDYYRNAHIDKEGWTTDILEVCECPYVPFIVSIKDGLRLSTSGGAWCSVPKKELIYKGKRKKMFCDWGSCGACAHGAVEFVAMVSVWEYKEPDSLFGEYSTKLYNKMYINKLEKPSDFGYMIVGDGIAFKTNKDYEAFLKTYRTKVFQSPFNKNSETIFMYKEENYYINKEEWENLKDYEIDTRMCNGSIITVKVKYDNENKKIHVYRYSNCFKPEEEIAKEPYILNR